MPNRKVNSTLLISYKEKMGVCLTPTQKPSFEIQEVGESLKARFKKERGNTMVSAQFFYNLRTMTGCISGSELHEIFNYILGQPSPAGAAVVEVESVRALALSDHGLAETANALQSVADRQIGEALPDVAWNMVGSYVSVKTEGHLRPATREDFDRDQAELVWLISTKAGTVGEATAFNPPVWLSNSSFSNLMASNFWQGMSALSEMIGLPKTE